MWLEHSLPYSYRKITLSSAEAGKSKEVLNQVGLYLGKESAEDDCDLCIYELYVPLT